MKLIFATGNPGKVISPKKELAKFGIELEQRDLGLPEIQADHAGTVAAYKAIHAYKSTQPTAVIVDDAALHIKALNGFPGPYVKPVVKQLGLEGLLRLMAPWTRREDRSCVFVDAWAIVMFDPEGGGGYWIETFIREIGGELATEPRGPDKPGQKSVLWKLFMPYGWDKTLAEMTEDELAEHRSLFGSIYEEIAAWIDCRRPIGRSEG
jgi:XTP/dITP diphosphohydrolase